MSLTKMSFVELHSPLFHAGKNHGTKLDYKKVWMVYDEDKQELQVSFGGRIARIPKSSIHSMEEMDSAEKANVKPIENIPATMDVNKIKGAQVQTPMSHVFEGRGQGKK